MTFFTTARGECLYYEVETAEEDSNETVLLIGGLTRDHTIWRKVVSLLKQHYRVIVFDNPDVGQSGASKSPSGIAEYADDVIELLQQLFKSYGPVHTVGQSMGGFMAMHIAAKHPELLKSLVLCSTVEKQVPGACEYLKSRIERIEKNPDDSAATTASEADIKAVMPMIYYPGSLTEAFIQEVVTFEVANPHPQSSACFLRQAHACLHHDASSLLNSIVCPTQVVTGEYDAYYGPQVAKTMAGKIPGVKTEVVVIPDAGHMVHIEQAGALAETIIGFIQ